MAENSQTTPSGGTESSSGTQNGSETTSQTSQTSSTTEQSLLNQQTDKSSEKSEDKSLLNQDAKKEGEAKEGEKAKLEGAPEKYADFAVPEGYELDKGLAETAGGLFKELNLTQTQAQKLIDFYSKNAIESSQAAIQAVKDTNADWQAKARALPGIGNELGPKGKVVVGLARAFDSMVSSGAITRDVVNDFKAAMDQTGAGNHPAFIQVIHALTSVFNEGSAVRGTNPSPHGQGNQNSGRRTAAQELYPNLPSAAG